MKLLVDLFPCQTPSRLRGIGRYTLSLTRMLAKLRGTNEMVVLADALSPESFEELRQEFIRLLPAGSYLPYYHEPLNKVSWDNLEAYSAIAETLIKHAYHTVAPDMVLTPSLFDGFGGNDNGMVPRLGEKKTTQLQAVILYDIIPYIFHEQYIDHHLAGKKWYLERLSSLQEYDLLLAISESTRQDAIKILGIKPDKIMNISGAASSHFQKLELSDDEKQNCLLQFGISRPFIFYVGGNDFRKNMDGALRAFAKLPREIIAGHQLVLNDVENEAAFRNKARKLGLADSDVVIANRPPDKDLVKLYNLCKLFIFPSLYEGFGLPILEAMTCGAPVIASNNSSLPEVVGRSDALFDGNNDQNISDTMYKVLTNDAFRAELAAYGPERAKQFSWEISAQRAWDAIDEIEKEKKLTQNRIFSLSQKKKRIAYLSPLPPQKSGIADYSASLLPYLAAHFDIDLFVEPGLIISDDFIRENFSIYPWTELIQRRDAYETVVYQVGNSEFHSHMANLLREMPGVVVAHDFFLSNLPFTKEHVDGQKGVFLKEIDKSHGLRGVIDTLKHSVDSSRLKWPINWEILKYAQELIVHSEHQNELINQYYAHGWKPVPNVISQIRKSVPALPFATEQNLRKELGLAPKAFIYCSFGFMAPTKLNNLTIQAFSQALSAINANTLLIFVGEMEDGENGRQSLNLIQKLNLTNKVLITGYVDKGTYEKYLTCADVAIQLHTDSRDNTSEAVLDCMAYGIPTILNSHGSFNDYSSDDVIKLPEVPSQEELSQAMVHLQTDEPFRLEKGIRAQKYVSEQHNPQKVAKEYADVIIRSAETNEKKIFVPLFDAISDLGSPLTLLQSSSKYAAANLTLRNQTRILIDVSGFENVTGQSTEQQAASEIVKEIFSINNHAIHMELVQLSNEQLLRAGRYAENIFELPEQSIGTDIPIIFQPGDVLLMIDTSISTLNQYPEIFRIIRQRGGKVITIVQAISERLLKAPAAESDAFLCGSHDIAKNVLAYLEKHKRDSLQPLDIFYPRADASISIWKESITWVLAAIDDGPVFNRLSQLTNIEKVINNQISVEEVFKKEAGDNADGGIGNRINEEAAVPLEIAEYKPNRTENGLLKSCLCSQAMLESVNFQNWAEKLGEARSHLHRKIWEWCYISQALDERELLKPGSKGLGFAVGQEPLSALFASYGCEILATDLKTDQANASAWAETNQHASMLSDLNKRQICSDDEFQERVSFRFVDMNDIPNDLNDFDFLWSSCSLEHLGSIKHGIQFITNSLRCLKPGGYAIHTTEFNLSSNDETVEEGWSVLFRENDVREIGQILKSSGHKVDLDFTRGNLPYDLIIDKHPYKHTFHLRLEISGFICTSYGLIIQKAF